MNPNSQPILHSSKHKLRIESASTSEDANMLNTTANLHSGGIYSNPTLSHQRANNVNSTAAIMHGKPRRKTKIFSAEMAPTMTKPITLTNSKKFFFMIPLCLISAFSGNNIRVKWNLYRVVICIDEVAVLLSIFELLVNMDRLPS